MSASFIPSLKHMALATTAIKICNDPKIRHLIEYLNFMWDKSSGEARWNRLFVKADIILAELNLPLRLNQSIKAVIRPISLEIARWKDDHYKVLCRDFDYESCEFYWKVEGIIDRQKTAEMLIMNKNVCKINRFYLACLYCRGNDAAKILNCMSTKEQSIILEGRFPFIIRFWYSSIQGPNAIRWSSLAQGVLNELYPSSFCNYQFDPIWLRCFFDQLSPEEKQQCIVYTVRKTFKDHDNFRFCVSQLDEIQRELVFQDVPTRLLRFFLDWPYQSLFSEAAVQMWKYLQKNDFRNLLHFIIYNRIAAEWYDFDYVNLLKDFWYQSPKSFKKYVTFDPLFEPLEMIINHDISQPFPKEEIIKSATNVEPPDDKHSLLRDGDFFYSG